MFLSQCPQRLGAPLLVTQNLPWGPHVPANAIFSVHATGGATRTVVNEFVTIRSKGGLRRVEDLAHRSRNGPREVVPVQSDRSQHAQLRNLGGDLSREQILVQG
jgi:hypothetical protein